jgi:hypothetical protein
MSWPRNPRSFELALVAVALILNGCGVKGDPLPPEKPVEMGRGRPTYKRAAGTIVLEPESVEDEKRD